MYGTLRDDLTGQLDGIRRDGLYKHESVINTPQSSMIGVDGVETQVLNLCANNYLGLADDARLVEVAQKALTRWGFGMASVRFICGTLEIHKELEARIAGFLHTDDAILYGSCFDANGGLFETLLSAEDAVISDELNHASIIDGVRLCKAARFRYRNRDMADLEARLVESAGARRRLIATDGVFSMDGHIANLPAITALADRYDALVMVDDCHATGHLGAQGRGTAALHGVEGRIDILTGTFGKTLGGGLGGFICAAGDVVALLRQRARPYLFSNSLSPATCGAAIEAIRIAQSIEGDALRQALASNRELFREGMAAAGFVLAAGETPIVPVMLGDERRTQTMAARLLESGIYVTGFSYPVVARGSARIRVQLSAAHSLQQVRQAIDAFSAVQRDMEIEEQTC